MASIWSRASRATRADLATYERRRPSGGDELRRVQRIAYRTTNRLSLAHPSLGFGQTSAGCSRPTREAGLARGDREALVAFDGTRRFTPTRFELANQAGV